jgi:hypothetical protein
MKYFLPCVILIAFACSPKVSKRDTKVEQSNPRPSWMSAKPSQSAYYSGIGYGNKQMGANYMQVAKKNALEDLVSEIKINVSATSILTTIDKDKTFTDAYESIIQTSVADEIEEYELVGSWEDENSYWVYYRLSKARYNEIKDQQRRNAVALALDFYGRAKMAEQTGDVVKALSFYFNAFISLEKYLAEAIRANFEGREVLLINDIYSSIQSILANLSIKASEKELNINRRVNQGQAIQVRVANHNGNVVSGLPLLAKFEKGAGDVFPDYRTDLNGETQVFLTRIDSKEAQQTLAIQPNIIALAGNEPSPLFELVSSRLTLPKEQVILKVNRPVVYMTADEKIFGEKRNSNQVSTRVKSVLTDAGFEFTSDKENAELWLKVMSDAEKGSVTGSIYVSFVSVIIKVEELQKNKEIYATSLERVRGFSLDYERSSQDAYNKVLETLTKETMPALINSVLQ